MNQRPPTGSRVPTQEVDLRAAFPALLDEDYSAAVVHLAWDREGALRRLLFGCVELLPNEVPPPVDDYSPDDSVRLGGRSQHYVDVRHAVTSSAKALAWYEKCRKGIAIRPDDYGSFDDTSRSFEVSSFSEEPIWPEFVCDSEFPYTADWHLSPRMHHLMPESAPTPTWSAEEREKVLQWLKKELYVDFDRYPELVGSAHFLAPNPTFRTVETSRERTNDGTLVSIRLELRKNSLLQDYQMLVREDRPTGTFAVRQIDIDSPCMNLLFAHDVEQFSIAISHRKRGLVYVGHPRCFCNQIGLDVGIVSAVRNVRVPPKKRRSEDAYQVSVIRDSRPTTIGPTHAPRSATQRLKSGIWQRRVKNAGQDLDQTWIDSDPEAATALIRSFIQPAKRQVFVIDGYFTAMELRRFGLACSDARVPIRILSSVDGLGTAAKLRDVEGTQTVRAREMAAELDHALASSHANPIAIRLMTGRPEIHDRFLIVDQRMWSLGSSLNELGSRGSLVLRVPDPESIIHRLESSWNRAITMADWLATTKQQ